MPSLLKQFLVFLLPANAALLITVLFLDMHHLHAEDGFLENFQVVTLLVAAALFCVSAIRASGLHAAELAGLGLLCVSFVLRELDLEKFPLPADVTQLVTGRGRTVTLLILWTCFLLAMLRITTDIKATISRQIEPGLAPYLVIAASLLVLSAVMDRGMLPLSYPHLIEELSEANAYLFLLTPAGFFCRTRSHNETPAQV